MPRRSLVKVHTSDVMLSAEETRARYATASRLFYGLMAAALLVGLVIAIVLAHSIVTPLRNAVEIADAVKQGRLDNRIGDDGSDETSQLLVLI